ncbi:tRNA 2-thiouridine(34) synthase isoform B [Chlorella sorokiniana]|uniref:tRNA-5-taurinomethyluridine 2-sulfurtransferase n=1 Tax=Chlorella sorokiniana TaxID=3076 RepID=A0A2P6THN1_CHLSO|nr:tRNA 2-thiouridine(34) synthase isoform B [Chlorella sorokiniana]|eukprot:PRW33801.1 tRNA 2-thiouridine(34) synthase isoform B [Chlorella sorokiniana]
MAMIASQGPQPMSWLEDVFHGALTATLLVLNACLVGCILVCASLLLVPSGLPSELVPHVIGLLLLAAALAFSVNWLVSLTGTVSPAEQQQELFGDAEPDLTAAGSTTVRPLGAPPSPPPVEQRLAGVPPEPASVPSSPLRPAAGVATAAAAAAEEIEEGAVAEAGKDKDFATHAQPAARLSTAAVGGAAKQQLAAQGLLPGQGRRVAVGISGGVDSAVAAMLLQQQGYEVVGVFMRNWDESEETGNQNCSVEKDARDAAAVCRQLGIPLHEADFVSQYWNQVFSEFLAQCGRGLTPNPDLACNRHIKFDALLAFADKLGAELVATGHYARLAPPEGGSASAPPSSSSGAVDAAAAVAPQPPPQAAAAAAAAAAGAAGAAAGGEGVPRLLRGLDSHKDQTYFLASVQPAALRRVLFPVGHLPKPEVRRMAAEAGLLPAERRSSAGICFIGRRNFGDFLSQYLPPLPGAYVDVDSGQGLGPCPDLHAVTHGQRPGIGGAHDRVYCVGKDVVEGVVYVAAGREHPALLCTTALLRTPHWLSAAHARQLAEHGSLRCEYKARYGHQPRPCTLYPISQEAAASLAAAAAAAAAGASREPAGAAVAEAAAAADAAGHAEAEAAAERLGFRRSSFCRLQPEDSRVLPTYLVARFDEPAAAITPQQAFVLYDGEQCLGAALIALPGASLHEQTSIGSSTQLPPPAAEDAG